MATSDFIVRLDVGGTVYYTWRSTLKRSGYLDKKSFSPNFNELEINRDGEMFRHVLNFLRHEKLMLPEGFTDFKRLQEEADFFKISNLSDALRDKISQVIGFNVGGKVYEISKDILGRYPDSAFRVISRPNSIPKDKKENYIIDRDGEIFQYVFNFLRSGNLGLPEGFNEFELLKDEAQFFSLKELEQLVKFEEMTRSRRIRTVGFVISGQVFKLRREDVLREDMSEFACIVKGDRPAPTDAQGNFIIEKAVEDATNLMHYLSHGGILKTMTSKDVERLKKDASRFGLYKELLEKHFKTMQFEGCDNNL